MSLLTHLQKGQGARTKRSKGAVGQRKEGRIQFSNSWRESSGVGWAYDDTTTVGGESFGRLEKEEGAETGQESTETEQ